MRQLSMRQVLVAVCIAGLAMTLTLPAGAQKRAVRQTSPFFADLPAGPYAIGFKAFRLQGNDKDLAAISKAEDQNRSLLISLFYPARTSAANSAMTFADYLYVDLSLRSPAGLSDESKRAESNVFKEFYEKPGNLGFGVIAEDRWAQLLLTKSLANRDAATAAGRFPLLIGQGNPFDSFSLDEYLASHGYVVARVMGADPPNLQPSRFIEWEARNLELAIAYLGKQANVDSDKLGLIGFSLLGGFPALLVAMRNAQVDALVTMDSPLFVEKNAHWLKPAPSYVTTNLRAPFLYLASAALEAQGKATEFQALQNSMKYRVLLNDSGVHHADLSAHGIVAAAVLKMRAQQETASREAHRWSGQYVRHFFAAYVKKERAGLAFLNRKPEAHGAPKGFLSLETVPPVSERTKATTGK